MTEVKITIKDGRYGKDEIQGEYTAIGPVKKGSRGWFVTVPGHELGAAGATARILVPHAEALLLQDGPLGLAFLPPEKLAEMAEDKLVHTPESDKRAVERMVEMFDILNEMGWDMTEGHLKGMIIYGPPGVGKSYGIIEALNEASLDRALENKPLRHTVQTGYMTPVHLYKALYEAQEPDQIIVFDDCDNILADPDSLNMLKAALDTTGERRLSYCAESNMLKNEGIENSFNYNGSIVFITNVDFDLSRGKIHDHLQAIISRCHYLDLTIDTKRDKFLWMREVTLGKRMLHRKGITNTQAQEIIDFIEENLDEMRELSLRMVLKIADLRKTNGKFDWKKKARVSCMKRVKGSSMGHVIPDNKIKDFEAKQRREVRKT